MQKILAGLLIFLLGTAVVPSFVFLRGESTKRVGSQQVLPLKIAHEEGVTFRGQIAKDCENSDSQIIVSVSMERGVDINKQPVDPGKLEERLKEIYRDRLCKIIWLDVSPELSYGQFAHVVDIARSIGVVIVMTESLKRELGYPDSSR